MAMKNPWMSLWLSAANSYASAARGFWSAEAQRQQQALMKQWMQAMVPAPASRKAPAKTTRRS
jgi:hypothetical protein